MLRKIRITLALLFWILITWLLVDFTGTAHTYLGWMARIQFMPALLAVNIGVLVFLVALTLLMGRIYCSVICPLGVMQDAIAWFRRKKNKYSYSAPRNGLRYTILALTGLFLVLNLGWLAGLLLPYSTYGRIVGSVVAPLYKLGNNVLAGVAEHYGSYAVYSVDVWLKSIPTLILAVVAWVVIAVLAWRGGRTWCNTVCPVGTLLGLLSRNAYLRPVFQLDKCNTCGKCARNCKAACIDFKNHQVDMSRCVMCGDCMAVCPKGSLVLSQQVDKTTSQQDNKSTSQQVNESTRQQDNKSTSQQAEKAGKPVDTERRAVLTSTALVAGAVLSEAVGKTTDGGFAKIEDKQKPDRKTRITPPGSLSIRNLRNHCTACQLCIDSCPNDVLRPSSSLDRLMQPEVSYERGYCRPECNRCSQVCPTSAIHPISVEERTATQVGIAKWVKERCIPVKDGITCGNCARHCPAGAIQMVPLQSGLHQQDGRWLDADDEEVAPNQVLLIPVVNEEKCIGCGACENLCPSRPLSAIYVEGNEVHREV